MAKIGHDEGTALCLRVDENDPLQYLSLVDASRQDRCYDCAQAIWVSPSTDKLVEARATLGHVVRLRCLQCVTTALRERGSTVEAELDKLELEPEQVAELEAERARRRARAERG